VRPPAGCLDKLIQGGASLRSSIVISAACLLPSRVLRGAAAVGATAACPLRRRPEPAAAFPTPCMPRVGALSASMPKADRTASVATRVVPRRHPQNHCQTHLALRRPHR
jgi:hypothetical protein